MDSSSKLYTESEYVEDGKVTAETDETQNLQYAYNGDRLLAYGNETFVYDILGNPTVYRNKALVWEKGRQLK